MPTPAEIDIVMPVYNCERYLAQSIDSVLAQHFKNWRLIVVDDCSTDQTEEIVQCYAARDPRIILTKGEHKGVAAAINTGLALVEAPFVARLDGDDIALPERLQVQYDFMTQHPRVLVLGSCATLINERDRLLRPRRVPTGWERIRETLKTRNCLCHPTVLIRTEALRQVGGYRDKFQTSQDYDLWLRLSEIGKIENLPQSLLLYRRHSSQVSASSNSHRQTIYSVGAATDFFLRRYGLPSETMIDEHNADDLVAKLITIYRHRPSVGDIASLNRHAIRLLRHARAISPAARDELERTLSPLLGSQQKLKLGLYRLIKKFGLH